MSPIFGLLVDKTGKNIIWVLCAVATTLASHVMLAFTLWNPWIAMVMWLLTPRGQGGLGSLWQKPRSALLIVVLLRVGKTVT